MILSHWKLPPIRKRRSLYAQSRAAFLSAVKHGLAGACLYLTIAYVALPTAWAYHLSDDARRIDRAAIVTRNRIGFASDPINLQIVGTRQQLLAAFDRAHWRLAEPVGISTAWRTCSSVLLSEPYPAAPVSDLFLMGRPQDLAFEQPAGQDPSRRHHVRLWDSGRQSPDGRPIWLAAASMDTGIRLCHFTARLTHRISPDIDAERQKILVDLSEAGWLAGTRTMAGIGPTGSGCNSTGDRYFTDGNVGVAELRVLE